MERFDTDICIIGGGIVGFAAAWFLSPQSRLVVVEQEDAPGRHASGRSAAMFMGTYGGDAARRLAVASKPFFDAPPQGFADHPLLTARGHLMIASADQLPALDAAAARLADVADLFELIEGAAARRLCPILRPEAAARALWEPDAADIDVDVLLQAFVRGARERGACLLTSAPVRSLEPGGNGWSVTTRSHDVRAQVIINAAGAWADQVAVLAGVAPQGLTPLRRTAILVDPPAGAEIASWPMVADVDEAVYFKPDAGRLLVSPADETPDTPHDVQPEELDVAVAVDRLMGIAEIDVRRVPHRWAGLRTFAPDRAPVLGWQQGAAGFFWAAGLGGFGVQTSAGVGAYVAACLAPEAAGGSALAGDPDFAALVNPRR
jgi:D-arginine dehydrogenase